MSDNDWKPDPEPRNRGFREYDSSCGSHHDKNPYNYKTWQWRSYTTGWADARRKELRDEAREREDSLRRDKEEDEWNSIKCSCPWFQSLYCEATDLPCEKHNCAPYYFNSLKG